MSVLFVLEDSVQDLRAAENAARSAGFDSVDAKTSGEGALKSLSNMLLDSLKLPDAFLIDLDLGQESGYEILRFRHSKPELSAVPAIVWTHLDSHHRQMCEVFGINAFVDKAEGSEALRTALTRVLHSD